MYIELEDIPREDLVLSLDKHIRLFEVAYRALLSIASPDNARDLQKDAAEALALIDRYPNDPEFSAAYKVTSQSVASSLAFRQGVGYCKPRKMG